MPKPRPGLISFAVGTSIVLNLWTTFTIHHKVTSKSTDPQHKLTNVLFMTRKMIKHYKTRVVGKLAFD
ncbi:hypothetical protein CPB86DRAFT_777957 [Serendipita vermifera]|nr:hypothetical protein CPB86DRAFT_777957 [Serendipita vermifera]